MLQTAERFLYFPLRKWGINAKTEETIAASLLSSLSCDVRCVSPGVVSPDGGKFVCVCAPIFFNHFSCRVLRLFLYHLIQGSLSQQKKLSESQCRCQGDKGHLCYFSYNLSYFSEKQDWAVNNKRNNIL